MAQTETYLSKLLSQISSKMLSLEAMKDMLAAQQHLIFLNDEKTFFFDPQNKFVWHLPNMKIKRWDESELARKKADNWYGFDDWHIPSRNNLATLLSNHASLINQTNFDYFTAVHDGYFRVIDKRNEDWQYSSSYQAALIWCSKVLCQKDEDSIANWLFQRSTMIANGKSIISNNTKNIQERLIAKLKNLDFNRCRLPLLTDEQISDKNLGLWELWGEDEALLQQYGLRARDPALDINQHSAIGIDFGTSSTVVAYQTANGKAGLLRVGIQDFDEEPKPWHYENPTALEFINMNAFLRQWQAEAYQPFVNWNTVHAAHEARESLNKNQNDPKIVGSILLKLKQWALREAQAEVMRFSDQQQPAVEHTLAPLTQNLPVKGQPLSVSNQDPFDPIELYAWFLGLNINYRGRGIFLKYYMTFPVAYPKAVREKILASFSRGLQRSLPESLSRNSDVLAQFSVTDIASEPEAYVAAAMEAHSIEPTEEGVPYAVFDFGGGTSDFDFGRYRWANEEEELHNFEYVFEHFEPAGDNYLGGENLLENLAYLVFKHEKNLPHCRQNEISFTKPDNAAAFSGSETLISKSQTAYANTLMMSNKLREFWEQGKQESNGFVNLNLLKRDGTQCDSLQFLVDYDELTSYLEERIAQGIERFLFAMKKAFGKNLPEELHILLSGNSCRSEIVADFFGINKESSTDRSLSRRDKMEEMLEMVFGKKNVPDFIIHSPLDSDSDDESIPTAKTGVALGILQLLPGKKVKTINETMAKSDDESPFKYYIGHSRRKKFEPKILRNARYGEWVEICPISTQNPSAIVLYTDSDSAQTGLADNDAVIHRKVLHFALQGDEPQKIFARPKTPNSIEFCVAKDNTALASGDYSNLCEEQL